MTKFLPKVGPLIKATDAFLEIKNHADERVAFKVKTTAPKQYCVRPTAGSIEPRSHVTVKVTLHPFDEDPPVDYDCKDKFLVLASVIKDEYKDLTQQELWEAIARDGKENIQQNKIRCNFTSDDEKMRTVLSGQAPAFQSLAAAATQPHTDAQLHPSEPSHPSIEQVKEPLPPPTMIPPPAAPSNSSHRSSSLNALAPVAAALPPSLEGEELVAAASIQQDIMRAKYKIRSLETELTRIRTNANQHEKQKRASVSATHQRLASLGPSNDGYPPKVLIMVAITVFLVTYLFF